MSALLREAALAMAGAALLLGLFFAPEVAGGRVLYGGDFSGSDLLELNVPRRHLAARALAEGRLPHWTPLLGNGLPLLAEGQAGVFYPPNPALFLALGLPAATNLSVLLALAVALLGGYLLGRLHGCRPAAAAVGALAWGLGGAFLFRFKHLNLIQVISWLPWSLACVEMLLRTRRPAWALAAACVWTLQILAGHPHAAYLAFLGTGLYGLARWAADRPPQAGRALTLGAGAAVLALLLAAVQLLPTWELVSLSLRGRAFTWENATAYPFRPEHLVRLVQPFAGGNPADASWPVEGLAEKGVFWESNPYLGLLPLALALGAPLLVRDRRSWWLAGAAGLCLALALGRFGGLYALLWQVLPGFDLFRFPARFLIPFAAFMALLAALGAEAALARAGRGAGLAGLVLVLVTAGDLHRVSRAYVGHVDGAWFSPPATVDLLGPEPGRVATPTYEQTWQAVYRMARGWKGETDLLVAHREVLAPDGCALYGVSHHADRILQEGGIELMRYARLQGKAREAMVPLGGTLALSAEAVRLLERQHVTHLLSFFPLEGPGLEGPVLRQVDRRLPGPLYLYRTGDPVPRVRVVGQAVRVPGGDEALDRLASPGFDPQTSVVLEEGEGGGAAVRGEASIRADRGDLLEVETRSDGNGYLVLLDNWHPAWQARVDGRPAPVLRADYAFQAVPVPAGRHRVVLEFHSPAFRLGSLASLAGLALWTGLLAVAGRKGLRAAEGGAPSRGGLPSGNPEKGP